MKTSLQFQKALMLLDRGIVDRGEALLRQVIDTAECEGDDINLLQGLVCLGEFLHQTDRHSEARPYLTKAVQKIQSHHDDYDDLLAYEYTRAQEILKYENKEGAIKFDFSEKGGLVIFDDFSVNFSKPLEAQLDSLKEDMLQVEFEGGYILDVGWRPSFSLDGAFYIVLIKNHDWEKPVFSAEARGMDGLMKSMELAMQAVN